MAIIGSITMDSITNSMLYMLVFGLGTWPMMLFVSFTGGAFMKVWNLKLLKIVPIVVAILFIVRGLGLGIPYISPSINPIQGQVNVTDCVELEY